jgi:predicted nucleic acid-binding protein
VIVLDASAAIAALLNDGLARRLISAEAINAPHLIDTEIISSLRRQSGAGVVSAEDARRALDVWTQLGIIRYAAVPLMNRVWELRQNITAYDATYVALAEALDCPLVTADARLSRAPGIDCAVTVVPN